MKPTTIATINTISSKCPLGLDSLPRVPPEFQKYLNDILKYCQHPKIWKLHQLQDKRSISSLSLLYLQPPLLFIDARSSSSSLESAAFAIDEFLSSHSVVDIIWEPHHISEPHWWILAPHPIGLPGHLFAMFDILQYRHPAVTSASTRFVMNVNCTKDTHNCTPGCDKTKIVVTWCAGWGADTVRFADNLLRSLVDFQPMQIGPVRYPYRKSFPAWNNQIGWSYTFGACQSNFLDCFFLDHSPCPAILADVWNDPGLININQKSNRFISNKPQNENYNTRPLWWKELVGTPTVNIPETMLYDLKGEIALHTAYSYFLRPKYNLRTLIHQKVDSFHLLQDSCAFMHVRRGDILLHGSQSRCTLLLLMCVCTVCIVELIHIYVCIYNCYLLLLNIYC
jgi:hypothetical protein